MVWRLRPRQDDTQSCISFRLGTEPFVRATSHVDHFGNLVDIYRIDHNRLFYLNTYRGFLAYDITAQKSIHEQLRRQTIFSSLQAGVAESVPSTLIPFARAMLTQRSASRTCHGLIRPRRGWSDSQAKSTRTDVTPAGAILAITARRVASLY